ncbi:MAG TPA: hypothetical protein VGO83_09635 [Thermoleophilaceae bacterium]|jgi:hypothetical protein|nr:hypothetical protein [Thermoleophilaceae bacterium]
MLRLRKLLAPALAMGLVAVPASAHHAASVSITASSLTLEPPKCSSHERRPVSRCDGYRTARVTWSGTCAGLSGVTVEFWASRAGGGKPILLDATEEADGLSGVSTMSLAPGAHVYATATMNCYWSDPDGTGPPAHTVSVRSAPTAEVTIPPWLTQVSLVKNNTCNFNPGGRTVMQAGQRGDIVDFSTEYLDRSLLGAGRRTKAGVRGRWVNVKGPGIRLRRHPQLFLLQEFGRREPFSGLLRPNPRRPGWHRFWEEVGGVRSNTLAIRAVPGRC